MDKDKRRVIGAAILLPLIVIVSLNNIGVISLSDVFFESLPLPIQAPIWINDYLGVYLFEACPSLPYHPGYYYLIVSPDYMETRIYPLGMNLLMKCPDSSCVHKQAYGLLLYDNITKVVFIRDSPIFEIEANKFCYKMTLPEYPEWEGWRIDKVVEVPVKYSNSTVCQVYDKDGKLIFEGSPIEGKNIEVRDSKVALAVICDNVTIAFAFSGGGAKIDIRDSGFVVDDLRCTLDSTPYPLKAYLATMKGNHPELAYDVYCAAFGGCTPTIRNLPEFGWIGWAVLIVLILLLLVVIF